MLADLAGPPGRRSGVILRVGTILGLSACVIVAVGVLRAAEPMAADQKAYWRPVGPPCPPVSRPALLRLGLPLDQPFTFQNMTLNRVAGGAFCSGESQYTGLFHMVVSGETVCQMTNPIAFSVVVGGHEYDFAPGVAKPATVTVSKYAVRCVLASNFKQGD